MCEPSVYDLLDQTQYLAPRIYEDPQIRPISLDLHSACAIGNYECVQDAIDSKEDINACNKAGWTPLMYASYVGHDTIVTLLLESDADARKGTSKGLTPLMVAAGCGNESVCYFLLQSGAEVDGQDSHGFTALTHAVRQGHQTVVQLLMESGASLELADFSGGHTSLMLAAQEGDEIIVDILIACGADIHSRDKEGHTARSLAFRNKHVRTVSLLDDAIYMYKVEHGSEYTERGGKGVEGDLFSGAKEMEAYQQSMAVKLAIQRNLGRRGGPRWSLPPEYQSTRRGSVPIPLVAKQKKLRPAMSMPEWNNPPDFDDECDDDALTTVQEEADPLIAELLANLGLEKYIEVFEKQEIDFQSLLSYSDDDLKRIGITLLGPRRKLSLALAELKEATKPPSPKQQQPERSGGRGSRGFRPQLMKQPSTELTTAYHQAMEKIEYLEQQLRQEHQLRNTTDSYLLELQRARQQAVACVGGVKDSQQNVLKHCKAVVSTHAKLGEEVDCLRLLATSTVVDQSQLHKLYSEIVALSSKMGLEVGALGRSVEAARQQVDTLSFHLTSSS